jgi:hypothetical protein
VNKILKAVGIYVITQKVIQFAMLVAMFKDDHDNYAKFIVAENSARTHDLRIESLVAMQEVMHNRGKGIMCELLDLRINKAMNSMKKAQRLVEKYND